MPDHAAVRTALPDLRRPLCRLAGESGGNLALQDRQGIGTGLEGTVRRQDRHHHRHAQADRQGGEVRPPGPRHHRRGAPFRRAPEGNAEGHARRGGRADPDRDADPAHAGHVDGRPARLLGDRHRAAEAPGDQDLRQQVLRRHHPRSGAA
ncbi:hypothetical protein SDC9_206358 [bioreactor metagenome]|uniref:Uncharacterized protein n=1 Tax=bioreactor metagenome TaxID=1076179 RepID=A0A645J4T0_9ZZZZ